MNRDLEPEPDGGGKKIREGVTEDRRVSVEDPEIRHGRKSKTKRFNGYKRHIAVDRLLGGGYAVLDARVGNGVADLLRPGIDGDHGREVAG